MEDFITRFLLHVVPAGFTKIRYSGLLSPRARPTLDRARQLLLLQAGPDPAPASAAPSDSSLRAPATSPTPVPAVRHCPMCHRGLLHVVARLQRPRPPP